MHNKNLDGLRGWAAFVVVIFHAILHYDPSNWQKFAISPMSSFSGWNDWITGLSLIVFNGDTAVVVFFVMSGLVLHESLMRSKEGWIRVSLSFIVKRVLRIYPAVIVCVLLTAGLSELWKSLGVESRIFTRDAIIENITLQGSAVLNVSWTLTIEMIAIAIILPAFFITRAGGIIAITLLAAYAIISTDNPALVLGIPNMHVAMISFIVGMALALPQASQFFMTFGKWAWAPILIALIFGNHINSAWATSSIIIRVMSAGLLVGAMRYSKNQGLDSFLSNRLSQTLGKISFSFYLFVVPVMYAVYAFTPKVPSDQAAIYGIPLGILIALITVPIAAISYKYIERPAMLAATSATARMPFKKSAAY